MNWTDGAHVTWHVEEDEILHLILQRNTAQGTSNIRRGPVDFNDEDSRVTYFAAWQNLKSFGPLTQRGMDITYMPSSLMKDGDRSGRIEDYWAIVSRATVGWPLGDSGKRLTIAVRVGISDA